MSKNVTFEPAIYSASSAFERARRSRRMRRCCGPILRPQQWAHGESSSSYRKGCGPFTIHGDPTSSTLLAPGNRVDIYLTTGGQGGQQTILLLQNVIVIGIGGTIGTEGVQMVGSGRFGGGGVTVSVLPRQASYLTLAQQTGNLTFALRSTSETSIIQDPPPTTTADLRDEEQIRLIRGASSSRTATRTAPATTVLMRCLPLLQAVGMSATIFIVLAAGFPSTVNAQRRTQRSLSLNVGEQRTIPNDGVESFSVGVDGQVIDVRISPAGDLVVVGTAVGTNTILLLFADGSEILYQVRVSDPTAVSIPRRDNIQLDFYFVQLAENYSYQIGLSFPLQIEVEPQIQLDLNAGFDLATTAAVTALPLPRVDFLETGGWARILRQASVITANGEAASFSGTEEANFIAATGLSSNVQSISAGAQVSVTPRYDPETGRIECQVQAEMSDMTAAVNGIPGRVVSSVNTSVNLEMGQAIVLGGLVSDSEAASKSGVPWLSQIPILGVLFGAHSSRRNYTQTVLFIIPSVVDTVSSEARNHVNEALRLYWDFTGGLDDVRLYEPGSGPSPLHPDALETAPRTVETRTRRRPAPTQRTEAGRPTNPD